MPLHPVAKTSAVPPGSVTEVQVEGESFALCSVDGTLYCIGGVCPHAGGPLSQGMLIDSSLICPWHGWEFDCRTGESTCRRSARVATYSVVERDGWVHVEIPAAQPAPEVVHIDALPIQVAQPG